MAQKLNLITAASKNLGIGFKGKLPWHLPQDMHYFKSITTRYPDSTVIMGRKTWESIPQEYRPLSGRKNIVVSNTLSSRECVVVPSLHESLQYAESETFVIGGQSLIGVPLEADVFLPSQAKHIFSKDVFPKQFKLNYVSKSFAHKDIPFDFAVYQNTQNLHPYIKIHPESEEFQYLNLIEEIIKQNNLQDDRTKTGIFSTFGTLNRWDLSTNFPLFTTKSVFFKAIVEELLWFIRGDTCQRKLAERGIHIWDAHASRQFLDECGLTHRKEGDLGPIYGFQWRHFGAKYKTCDDDYTGQGVDQLQGIIELIKNDPNSRRIVLTAWNPMDTKEMSIPPCPTLAQFYVSNGKLSCCMYQRAGDMGLGVPFDTAQYALLTCMIAQICGLQRGELIHMMGNAHVYQNHKDGLLKQIKRKPNCFPILKLNPDIMCIDDFKSEDIELIGYTPKSKIKLPIAV